MTGTRLTNGDWTFAIAFSWGECLAASHYANVLGAIARGAGIFCMTVALFWLSRLIRRSWIAPTDETRGTP